MSQLYKIDKGNRNWTPEEDAEITKHYPDIPKLEGRDRRDIKRRATRIGLRLSPEQLQKARKRYFSSQFRHGRKIQNHERLKAIEKAAKGIQHNTIKIGIDEQRDGNHVSRLFTREQDKKILEMWPDIPKIADRTKQQIERRYKLLVATRV